MELEGLIVCGPAAVRQVVNVISDAVKSKAYWVDTLCALPVFYPMSFFTEMSAGMSFGDSLDARMVGFPVDMVSIHPLCRARDVWAEKVWNVDENSGKLKRGISDLTFLAAVQPLIYGSVLATSGASFDEMKFAIPYRLAVTVAVGIPYAFALDKVRDYFGVSPLKKNIED
ncbi:L-alanine exporter AlaE [Candidatus Pacearchaeota archaeon]|nr:L-alanine exporter AlaE [Candidatus Pacearchaeota archaeon]